MPNQNQEATVPSEIAEQLKQIPVHDETFAALEAAVKVHDETFAALEAAVKDRAPQNIREAVDMCAHPLPTLPTRELPDASGLLSHQAWTLKCLTDDVRSVSKVLYGEQRANATLALRHLEDALHRMILAQSSHPVC